MEYLDPFEKKKGHVILFFFTTLALLKSKNGVNGGGFFFFFFFLLYEVLEICLLVFRFCVEFAQELETSHHLICHLETNSK